MRKMLARALLKLAHLWEGGVPHTLPLGAWAITCYYASQWLFELERRVRA